ncbi:hypothetical protein N0V83_010110 [Neocucurbitaria cava]|uniref:gamma-glutamylcyclotransferase n=1 Tax=Neocucurbitaria cava TaxID=798079 RepID=A0A9W8XZ06_9PLEO|nr:hypothetical protein N0V83_010110 [Neocucurbitaria cava]
MAAAQTPQPTIYFGYGSNLWLHQMRIRCPTSTYLGIARLNNYKWLINDRGYANVVEVPKSQRHHPQKDNTTTGKYSNVVFGLVYTLQPSDEQRLDKNEGVPIAYTKELLPCDFWSSSPSSSPSTTSPHHHHKVDTSKPPTTAGREMLVYIDRERVTPDEPKEEYIYRMNKGIADAVDMGVPERYVEEVMRKFIPEPVGEGKGERDDKTKSMEDLRKSVEEFAARQAASFRDESGVFE